MLRTEYFDCDYQELLAKGQTQGQLNFEEMIGFLGEDEAAQHGSPGEYFHPVHLMEESPEEEKNRPFVRHGVQGP